ncbi:MAG: NADH-quinone oxidoreductase subunit C [Armatimonadota bacterium]
MESIKSRFPSVEECEGALFVPAEEIAEVCAFAKCEGFDYLMSLTAVDWADRFDLVYHLYSIPNKSYVTLKVKTERENPVVPSVVSVWKAADWQEREVYDMFGVEFAGHPDLTRILLEPDWEGFPLRKDYDKN